MAGYCQKDHAQYQDKIDLVGLSIHSDDFFMKQAYQQALCAQEIGEVPVGAVVVSGNQIISRGHNQTEMLHDSTAHAEMLALTAAFNHLGAKYLSDCTLYVTLEPCVMCAGATYWAHIAKIVYAASDPRRGFKKYHKNIIHPKTKLVSGVLKNECGKLLDLFFENLRN